MRRARMLLTTILAATAIAAASCDTVQRDDEGDLVESAKVGARDIEVGDCYYDDPEQSGEETLEVFSVDAVPCDEPHDNEVYALFDLPDGEFPGDDVVVEQSYQGCLDRFAGFVGMVYEQTTLDIGILYPLEEAWDDDGDREVVCSIFDPGGAVTGSLEDEGEQYRLAVQGDCMDESGLAVDCDTEHYAEIYLETELDGDPFPGTAAVEEEAVELCGQAFPDFVGTEYEASELDFVYWTPNEQSWAAGYTVVSCAVYDPAGPLSGSVQGRGR